ncbi:MAG: site-2 protease family protein [candidate division WOR-3 bacterium]|nr:MAG: site-2 protease family protein [candidate division WOR-3 bacterium]
MFGRSIRIFTLFGFEVKIDLSWVILALLITWSLAQGLFPHYFKGLTTATYWWMGIFGALGLFFSIVFHELCHSLVARKYGLPIKGITLFIFGGVASMEEEPPSAKAEFLMAIAGPASSIVLGLIFFIIRTVGIETDWSVPLTGIFTYLSFINWVLAGFNLIPAFPLDGGRVLRSALWKWKNDIRWSTRIASRVGAVFGLVLIFLGVIQFFSGNFIGGIWWFMIGIFLQNAARMSYQQLITRQALEGENVRDFMKPDPVTVTPSITVEQLVEDFIYKYHFKMFPVVEGEKLIGCITTRHIKGIPKAQWSSRTVAEIAKTCSSANTIDPETDAIKALSIMNRTGNSRLMVVEGNKLVGILALKDIMKFLSIKLDLEGYVEKDTK